MPNTELITVHFLGRERQVPSGCALKILADEVQNEVNDRIVAGIVNNHIRELTYMLTSDCQVQFLTMADEEGLRIYRRGLLFVLIRACSDVLPGFSVIVHHSLGNGLYCELRGGRPVGADDVARLATRMSELVAADLPITKRSLPVAEAAEIFSREGQRDKVRLLKYRQDPSVNVYELDGIHDYFYGYMVPSTGYLDVFSLIPYRAGVLLQSPEAVDPKKIQPHRAAPKLGDVFAEAEYWAEVLEVADVGQLNEQIDRGCGGDIIRVAEALHEKRIAGIADAFCARQDARLILIAGPSSSGKTTFAQRLAIHLRVLGLKPVSISLDNYFVNREQTPRDENGEYDFEALETVDIGLFNDHLVKLLSGQEIEMPCFNFYRGQREWHGDRLRVEPDQPIIIEGIHGLNEKMTPLVPADKKFKIYVSALFQLNLDAHNRIPTTDARIIRRMVRDNQYRGHNALETIRRWPSVRRGENRYIFPYQEAADAMFNSSLVYELSVLKPFVEPLLKMVDDSQPEEFMTAQRLLKFLAYVRPLPPNDVPQTSILREFIGGTCFKV